MFATAGQLLRELRPSAGTAPDHMTELMSPELWRRRAEEARRQAEQTTPEERATLLQIATLYDQLSARIERQSIA